MDLFFGQTRQAGLRLIKHNNRFLKLPQTIGTVPGPTPILGGFEPIFCQAEMAVEQTHLLFKTILVENLDGLAYQAVQFLRFCRSRVS